MHMRLVSFMNIKVKRRRNRAENSQDSKDTASSVFYRFRRRSRLVRSHINACPLVLGTPVTKKFTNDLKNAAVGAFAAMTIASSVIATPADAIDFQSSPAFSSSTIVSEKVIREGLYRDYEVDLKQEVDDARSTFKGAKETKSKKGESMSL